MSASAFDLTGSLAVVTGASRGIGEAMALALAEAGADIVGVSSTMTDEHPLATAVASRGRVFHACRADLGEPGAIGALVDELEAVGRPVDILVNNAGIIRRSPATVMSEQDWNEVLQVDLTAPFLLAQALGAGMVERGRGKVLFTASLLSFQGGINVVGYAAAKSAVAGVTRALSNEWAGSGVCVNAIAPGYIATDNTRALQDDPDRSRSIVERIPAGRWGRPSDLAGATVFLTSSASDYVSGVVLPVDGGWMGR